MCPKCSHPINHHYWSAKEKRWYCKLLVEKGGQDTPRRCGCIYAP